jgi:Mg2+-importing ATPase
MPRADVAKDAADIILLGRDPGVLHAGILEGRRAFGNVMKYLLMGTNSNSGNMSSMAAAFLFLPFLPMLPTQILLNNFLYDLAQITIPTNSVDDDFIRRPQRWNIGIIQRFMVVIGPISSIYDFLTFGVLVWVFRAVRARYRSGRLPSPTSTAPTSASMGPCGAVTANGARFRCYSLLVCTPCGLLTET